MEKPLAELVEMLGHFLNERRVELIERGTRRWEVHSRECGDDSVGDSRGGVEDVGFEIGTRTDIFQRNRSEKLAECFFAVCTKSLHRKSTGELTVVENIETHLV